MTATCSFIVDQTDEQNSEFQINTLVSTCLLTALLPSPQGYPLSIGRQQKYLPAAQTQIASYFWKRLLKKTLPSGYDVISKISLL